MKAYKLLKALGQIDEDLICTEVPKQKRNRKAWLAAAACLCLIITAALVFIPSYGNTPTPDIPAVDSPAADLPAISLYCYLNDRMDLPYEPMELHDRILYGLVPEGSMGTQETLSYRITEEELGEYMGTVTDAMEEALIGSEAYHFARYPESEAVCIIKAPDGYRFYVCREVEMPIQLENSAKALLHAYGLPDSLTSLELMDWDGDLLGRIDDPEVVRQIFVILADCPDIGREEYEMRYVRLWKDTYGTDEIYYDEYNRTWRARELEIPATDPYRGEPDYLDYDLLEKANDLFREGACWIRLETNTGMSRDIEFTPAICGFRWDGGHYALSPEDTARLAELLTTAQ